MFRTFLDGLYRAAGYLAGLFLLVIFGLMMGLSFGRKVGINITDGDDFAAWSMAAMAFLGLAYTFRSGEVIRVGLLIDRLGGRPRRMIELFCLVLGTGLVAYFAWYAVQMTYDSYRFNDMSQGVLGIPLWIPQLGYSVGLVILAIAFMDDLVRVVSGRPPSYDKPPASTPEEVVERAMESGF
jgi:TRAP-type C4-dicarboxylate transport system permease small subunit